MTSNTVPIINSDVPAHLPILIRPMERSDRALVVLTWMHSYAGRRSSNSIDKTGQWRLANALLDRCPITIAAYKEDPATIVGWCCTGTKVVHYVWVRGNDTKVEYLVDEATGKPNTHLWRDLPDQDRGFRRQGIASYLLKDFLTQSDITYTHAPSFMWQRKQSHVVKLAWDNNRVRNPHPHQVSAADGKGTLISIPAVPSSWRYDPYLPFEIAATVPEYREHAAK